MRKLDNRLLYRVHHANLSGTSTTALAAQYHVDHRRFMTALRQWRSIHGYVKPPTGVEFNKAAGRVLRKTELPISGNNWLFRGKKQGAQK